MTGLIERGLPRPEIVFPPIATRAAQVNRGEDERASRRGRPREFDIEQALEAALLVFWEKGFEGASLSDLTSAMGIARPSLYATFGSKEGLFRRALDRYETVKVAYVSAALEAPTAHAVARLLLEGAIDIFTAAEGPRGCLHVANSLACGTEAEGIRSEVLERTRKAQDLLEGRMAKAVADGDFRSGIDADAISRYLTAVIQGLAVHAKSGASRAELQSVVALTLQSWPRR